MSKQIRFRRIRLEASSLCQLKCPSCPNTKGDIYPAIGRGILKLADFESLLEQNHFVKEVELSNYGEMFLNPDLTEMIKAAHERGVLLQADNGVNLNSADKEQLEALVRYRFRSLTCSIDGATPKTYSHYRINGRFKKVINNISIINQYKKEYRSRYPILTWQFIVFGHNEHEIPKARQLARELGMMFKLKLSWDEEFSPTQNPEVSRREIGYASRSEYRRIHGLDRGHGICRMLWEQPQINWDGRVLGCSRNFWGEFGGNVFTDGLLPAVNSDSMWAARNMLRGRSNKRGDVPCADCEIYQDRVSTGQFVRRDPVTQLTRSLVLRVKNNRWARSLGNRIRKG